MKDISSNIYINLLESEMKKSKNYIISKNFAISGRKGEISGRIKACFQYAVGGFT
jgi:hypothetical protein